MQRRFPRIRLSCCSLIEPGFETGNKRVDDRSFWTPGSAWRHHAGAQFADDFLPGFSVIADMLEVQLIEHQAGGFSLLVVTTHAILIEKGGILSEYRGRTKHQYRERKDSAQFHFVPLISFLSRATVLGFRSAPTDARNTPSAHATGVRPTASFTSTRPPFSTRNLIMSSEPRLAAPMMAVNPIEFTALTSAP